MSTLDRALAYFTLTAPYMDAFDVLKSYRQTTPPVSRTAPRAASSHRRSPGRTGGRRRDERRTRVRPFLYGDQQQQQKASGE